MTKFDHEEGLPYDPKIERTTKGLQKQAKLMKYVSITSTSASSKETIHETTVAEEKDFEPTLETIELGVEIKEEKELMAQEITSHELATPNGDQTPLCIIYPNLKAPFEQN